ncbi:Uncharacterised protein [uncultured archaeon]|nr:Uncharacterised protein [uncultured archaeon]
MNWRGIKIAIFKKAGIKPKNPIEPPLRRTIRVLNSMKVSREEKARIIKITRRVLRQRASAKAMGVNFHTGINLKVKEAEKEVEEILGLRRGNQFWARANDPYF